MRTNVINYTGRVRKNIMHEAFGAHTTIISAKPRRPFFPFNTHALSCLSHVLRLRAQGSRLKVRRTRAAEGREAGDRGTRQGVVCAAQRRAEPFINYGERASGGGARAASREGAGYVDREARAASEASIELASFPVATALKPPSFTTLKRSAAAAAAAARAI